MIGALGLMGLRERLAQLSFENAEIWPQFFWHT